MNIKILIQIASQTWYGLVRHGILSMSIVITMSMTMIVLQSSILTSLAIDTTVATINKQIDLNIDLKDNIEQFEIDSILSALRSHEDVREAYFTSQDDANKSFSEKFPDLSSFFVDENIQNPLSSYITISTYNPSSQESILSWMRDSSYIHILNLENTIESSDYHSRTEELLNFTRAVNMIAGLIGLVFILFSAIVIYNIIRITIFHRKYEIDIMFLTGAPISVIRAPFVLESISLAIISSIIAMILFSPILSYISDRFAEYIPDSNISFDTGVLYNIFPGSSSTLSGFFDMHMWQNAMLILGISIVIAGVSSAIAIYKYEK